MRCQKCGKDLPDSALFCGICGTTVGAGASAGAAVPQKTCANGHIFDAHLAECPWCPRSGGAPGPAHDRVKFYGQEKRKTVIESAQAPASAASAGAAGAAPADGRAMAPPPPSQGAPKRRTIIESGDRNPFARPSGASGSPPPVPGTAPALRGWLVVLRSGHLAPYHEFRIHEGANVIGGVAPGFSADIPLCEPGTELRHARLTNQGRDFVLEDGGGRVATLVDGQRVQKVQLPAGCRVTIGNTTMVFVPFLVTAG